MPLEHLQERWHFHQRMNKKVWNNIHRLRNIALSNPSKQEVLDALHPWRLSISLRYNNTFSYLLLGISILLLVGSTLYLYQTGLPLLLCWIVGIFLAAYALLSIDKQSEVEDVINLLQDSVFQSQYDIKFSEFPTIDQNIAMNQAYMLAKVTQGFPCLNEGNAGNEIAQYAATHWHIDGHDYPVLLLHYIAVSEIVIRNQKGEEIRKRIETPRWGACVFDMPALALVISSENVNYERYPVRWTSSDIQFNQRFYLYGQQEFELAKNLSPLRTLTLANHLQHMKGRLVFHEQMQAFCYLSRQNIFECKKPAKNITDVSQLRGYLRTLQAPHYEQMQRNLTAIIRSFRDENLLH